MPRDFPRPDQAVRESSQKFAVFDIMAGLTPLRGSQCPHDLNFVFAVADDSFFLFRIRP